MMRDNKTSQPAREYDANVTKTIPYYNEFHNEILALVTAVHFQPDMWLDTGCGTGTFAAKAMSLFTNTRFILADPAVEMLNIAKQKFAAIDSLKLDYVQAGTEKIDYPQEKFDVITAILSHHYFDFAAREQATRNCWNMLSKGGLYITFESIIPNSSIATKIGLQRWKNAQIKNGKSLEAVDRHINRFGVELHPITIDSHLRLLKDCGFSVTEILWVSGMQAGFYAIK